ncbi:hypothetical protein GALMADRAFT_145939 [Galerina marginata CBS 339.88]|uniref:Uncharacterized protein n=1 Tax=Galerina marginata (strain CBS 339.88) TaxID=685588 RepID=A0A067SG06_GALM3|nr:hypothetical protein GALMADRAFT_145939 [Galerina marginata CBS 339.88]
MPCAAEHQSQILSLPANEPPLEILATPDTNRHLPKSTDSKTGTHPLDIAAQQRASDDLILLLMHSIRSVHSVFPRCWRATLYPNSGKWFKFMETDMSPTTSRRSLFANVSLHTVVPRRFAFVLHTSAAPAHLSPASYPSSYCMPLAHSHRSAPNLPLLTLSRRTSLEMVYALLDLDKNSLLAKVLE